MMKWLVYKKSENREHRLGAPECEHHPAVWGMKKVGEGLVQFARFPLRLQCVELVVESSMSDYVQGRPAYPRGNVDVRRVLSIPDGRRFGYFTAPYVAKLFHELSALLARFHQHV
jgi:hypothetical protein